jgi:hypothetical protein
MISIPYDWISSDGKSIRSDGCWVYGWATISSGDVFIGWCGMARSAELNFIHVSMHGDGRGRFWGCWRIFGADVAEGLFWGLCDLLVVGCCWVALYFFLVMCWWYDRVARLFYGQMYSFAKIVRNYVL